MNEPLDIKYDEQWDTVTICGIKYSGQIFRLFAFKPDGSIFRFYRGKFGCVTVEVLVDSNKLSY